MPVVRLDIPKDLLSGLDVPEREGEEFVRKTLAVELYREGRLSLGKARELAGLGNKWKMLELLAERGVEPHYTADDAEEDRGRLAGSRR